MNRYNQQVEQGLFNVFNESYFSYSFWARIQGYGITPAGTVESSSRKDCWLQGSLGIQYLHAPKLPPPSSPLLSLYGLRLANTVSFK